MKTLLLVTVLSSFLGCRAAATGETNRKASAYRAASPATPSADEALDKLDQRRPVPLLPMMAQHQRIRTVEKRDWACALV